MRDRVFITAVKCQCLFPSSNAVAVSLSAVSLSFAAHNLKVKEYIFKYLELKLSFIKRRSFVPAESGLCLLSSSYAAAVAVCLSV